jgi:D-serine deaminase-like pyridoxal phosphate-dependent protein
MYEDVVKPTMILHEQRVRANIERMAQRARRNGVRFRPHFKTHQSAAIGAWFRAAGVTAITASSVDMATYFADHGWDDITVAFPANVRELPKINALASRVRLHLLVESTATVQLLDQGLTSPVGAWIEVDAGSGRSGVPWQEGGQLHTVATAITSSQWLSLQGLLTHAGNTYAARAESQVRAIHSETVTRLQRLRNWLLEYGFLGLEISIGDTPACSMLEEWGDVDEARPGNFVFYDLTQLAIGACTAADVGFVVACPVVAIYPARYEIVLYGGAVHLSKEMLSQADGSPSYGVPVRLTEAGWSDPLPGAWLRSLSQEHGVLRATPTAWAAGLEDVQVGDLLGVLPVHSCLTADLLKEYRLVHGARIPMMSAPLGA